MIFLWLIRHVASIVTLLLVFASCALAQSQPPTPTPSIGSSQIQDQGTGEPAKGQTNANESAQPPPTPVSPVTQTNQADPQKPAQEQNNASPHNDVRWWVDANWVIALVTLGLFWLAYEERKLNRTAHATTIAIERAWISLEALEVEGVDPNHHVIAVGFKNAGHTTARIHNANVTLRSAKDVNGTITFLNDLPDDPVYDDGVFTPPAILVPGEVGRMRLRLSRNSSDDLLNSWALRRASPDSEGVQWIYGFITYTDGLEPEKIRIYRWARQYDPWLSRQGATPKYRFAHIDKPKYNHGD